jgi:CheY-like chemotaxis protein
MGGAGVKDEDAPKQLGRIMLKRKPARALARSRDPAARHAQLVALSERYGVPALDLEQVCLKTEDLGNVPRSLAQHHLLIPVLARADRLFVAMTDPSQIDVIQEVEFVAGKRVYAYAAPAEDIAEAISRAYLARERGALHFVGSSCPPETLRKAGILPDKSPESPESPQEPALAGTAALDASSNDAAVPHEPLIHRTDDEGDDRRIDDHAEHHPEHTDDDALEAALAESNQHQTARAELPNLADDDVPDRGTGPTATVSAYPPRPSLPPLGGDGFDREDETRELLAGVQQAFDELLDDESAVSRLPAAESFEEPRDAGVRVALVAEDDPESRALIERALREDGYYVRVAESGRQALRLIKDRAPDLLIVSALLPEVHGFEIAQRLRGSERYGNLPIVMIGAMHRGWRWADDQRESCGVEHYLEHPLSVEAIQSAATRACGVAVPSSKPSADMSARAERALEDGMLAYRNGDVRRAIAHLEEGVNIDPLAYRLHFHLGLLFAQQGQTYDAIRALERAVEINSRHFGGVKNLAIMYGQAGFRNRAVELWQRGLTLAPDDETRNAIVEHLAGLLSQDGLS